MNAKAIKVGTVLSMSSGPVQVEVASGGLYRVAPLEATWRDDGTPKGRTVYHVVPDRARVIKDYILHNLVEAGLAKVEDRAEWGV